MQKEGPGSLSREAKAVWRRVRKDLIAMQKENGGKVFVGSIDRDYLAGYCQAVADWNLGNRKVHECVRADDLMGVKHWNVFRKNAEHSMQQYGDRLCLGEKMRQRVTVREFTPDRNQEQKDAVKGEGSKKVVNMFGGR